jgi:hypothetical protein
VSADLFLVLYLGVQEVEKMFLSNKYEGKIVSSCLEGKICRMLKNGALSLPVLYVEI